VKTYSRLRDFLEDGDEDVPLYFAYSASLRIGGDGVPFEEIESTLNLPATHKHRKGELQGNKRGTTKCKEDMWMLSSPLPENETLDKHLDWLWTNLGSHIDYLISLKEKYRVDIFAGYRSNCDHAGVEIPAESMRIYYELNIPFGLSIIVA
jgi:hypothetical protein